MKLYSKIAIASAFVLLAFVSTASAQAMRVNVPFGFRAGNEMLPAGVYRVQLNLTQLSITLDSLERRTGNFIPVKALNAARGLQAGSLVFNRYGDSYFLARVNPAGVDRSAEVFSGRAEREMAKRRVIANPIVIQAAAGL